MNMEQASRVIREISHLGLRPEAERLAYQLADEIDLPVAFIVDSEADKNFSGRHSPTMPNAFWGNIKPQSDPREYERLVLAHLYHGIQERKRYLHILPNDNYVAALDDDHKKSYFDFITHLNSFVLSLDTEFFLRNYCINTSWDVHHAMLDDRVQKLREYIQIRKRTPGFRWYREIEVCNLVDYGNYYRRGKAYRDKLLPVVRQVNPKYLTKIQKVAEIINTASQRYTSKTSGEIVAWTLRKLVKLFRLESMVILDHTLAFVDTFPITNEITAPVFSFIPDDYERQTVLAKGIRYANYFLTLVQEMYGFHMPTTLVYLINHDSCNAYANPGQDGEYIIAFTTTFFYRIHDFLFSNQLQTDGFKKAKVCGEEDGYLDKFFRYVVFFVTAHEYGHILNGDCDGERKYNPTREENADTKACELLSACFIDQYRPRESTARPPASIGGNIEAFVDWFASLPIQERLDYARNAYDFEAGLCKDKLILNEAIEFAKDFLRNQCSKADSASQ